MRTNIVSKKKLVLNTCSKTFLKCFALEHSVSKAKHCRSVLGQVFTPNFMIQSPSFRIMHQTSRKHICCKPWNGLFINYQIRILLQKICQLTVRMRPRWFPIVNVSSSTPLRSLGNLASTAQLRLFSKK